MKFLKRSAIPLLLVAALLLPGMVIPASAVTDGFLDYNDYITDIQVDGDNDLVTVSIPISYSELICWKPDGTSVRSTTGSLYVPLLAGEEASYTFSIFAFQPGSALSWENMPGDTVFEMTVSCEYLNFENGFVTPYVSAGYYQVMDNFKESLVERVNLGAWNYNDPIVASFSLNKSAEAKGFRPFLVLQPIQFFVAQPEFTLHLDSFVLKMSISSLYRLQEETGKTNELLQLVLDKLGQIEQENLTWYEKIWQAITDGFAAVLDAIGNLLGITPEDAAGAKQFEQDAADKSDELQDKIEDMDSIEKPDPEDVQTDVESVLPDDGAEYVGQTMNIIVENPIVSNQLAIVVILMFASYVLFGKKAA